MNFKRTPSNIRYYFAACFFASVLACGLANTIFFFILFAGLSVFCGFAYFILGWVSIDLLKRSAVSLLQFVIFVRNRLARKQFADDNGLRHEKVVN